MTLFVWSSELLKGNHIQGDRLYVPLQKQRRLERPKQTELPLWNPGKFWTSSEKNIVFFVCLSCMEHYGVSLQISIKIVQKCCLERQCYIAETFASGSQLYLFAKFNPVSLLWTGFSGEQSGADWSFCPKWSPTPREIFKPPILNFIQLPDLCLSLWSRWTRTTPQSGS